MVVDELADLPVDTGEGLVAAVQRDLERAGKADSLAGQQALTIARRMVSPRETGASVATLSRELRALMTAINVKQTGDTVDEVKERRDAKLRAASAAG